jgi:hypothetical protein
MDGIPFCEKAWVMMEFCLQQPNLSGAKHITVGGDLEINVIQGMYTWCIVSSKL